MNLARLRANVDFRQSSSSIFGYPGGSAVGGDNTGTAKLFEAVSARAGRPSSAAAKNTRDLCRANHF